MKYLHLVLLLILISCAVKPAAIPHQPIRGSDLIVNTTTNGLSGHDITYGAGFHGYLTKPADEGRHPGIVLVHEWWGLNDYIKKTADQLASEGFIVLAVDLYDGSVATTPPDAQKYMGLVNNTRAVENMRAAAGYLRNDAHATSLASMGWCFGGGKSLQLALSGEKLDATVIYYGQLTDNETQLAHITWPVLGIFGEKDQSISASSARAFDSALTSLNVTHETYIYPNVGHAFANPSGMNFAPNETKDAWQKTITFLKKYLH